MKMIDYEEILNRIIRMVDNGMQDEAISVLTELWCDGYDTELDEGDF